MKQQTIDRVVKELNRSIRFYQRKLTHQPELKYKRILSDLATVKSAIKECEGEFDVEVEIYGTLENRGQVYPEFTKALNKARLDMDGDGYGKIWLSSIEEREEELAMEEEQMAMQLAGLMEAFGY